jgi:hypothetical protein
MISNFLCAYFPVRTKLLLTDDNEIANPRYYTIIALGGGRYKNISTSEKHID